MDKEHNCFNECDSSSTRNQQVLNPWAFQQSPSKEMEISAAKVNAVLQESLGLSEFRSPPPTFLLRARTLSKPFRWQNTTAIVRASWSQSIQGRHTLTTLSLTWSALPSINSQGKEISPCATTPSSCQEQRNTQIPSYNNCIATRKKPAELHYLTPMAHRSSI